ncbi:MAG: caspase domain-containing protein, partial [Bacteroidota bacterium]
DLSSANDVMLVREMLKEQRFEEKNISYLIDKDATPENLNAAFGKLKNTMQKGDLLYFHFSGHGQQVADIKPKGRKDLSGGDEYDLLDEALVLYNAPLRFEKGYEMEHHYVDDQLRTQLKEIRTKLGEKGQVVLVMDACHTGTSTRGKEDPVVRGAQVVCAPEGWERRTDGQDEASFATDFEAAEEESMARIVAFFGCKANQVNNEYLPDGSTSRYGSLTYFLMKGMKKLGENATYASLFAEIRKEMLENFSGKQIPEIEGDGLNMALFSNTFIPTKPFHLVDKVWTDNVELSAGFLAGIGKGDEIGLFASDVNDPKKGNTITTGKVEELSAFRSMVQLSQPIDDSGANPALYRAFVIKKAASGSEIKVKLDLKKHQKELESRLTEMANVKLVRSDYDYLVKETQDSKVIIYVGLDEDMPLRGMSAVSLDKPEKYDTLINYLKEASKVELFRGLEINDYDLDFSVRVYSKSNPTVELSQQDLVMSVGSDYIVKVTNNGFVPIYLNLVDIQPDYIINHFNISMIPAGSTKTIPLSQVQC